MILQSYETLLKNFLLPFNKFRFVKLIRHVKSPAEPGIFAYAKIERALLNSERELAHEMNLTVLFRYFERCKPLKVPGGERLCAVPKPLKLLIQLFSKSWRSRGCVSLVALRRERNPPTNGSAQTPHRCSPQRAKPSHAEKWLSIILQVPSGEYFQ